ncbi:MAG: DUF433 domain-containing protein [Chloroflexota bacterium]
MARQILVDSEKFLGEPYLEGTTVPLSAIIQWVEAGLGPEEIVAVYPDLSVEDVKAALAHHDQQK